MTHKAKVSRQTLRQRIKELEAQIASTYHFADATIEKAGQNHMMASGVLLELTALGGRQLINPVVIKDGLSETTIAAIRADLRRSYEQSVSFKPKGVTP